MRKLADASLSEVLKAWQGLGYYQRARNVHRAARIFCDRFGGRIPDDPAALSGVPGFGPYTTGAVLSIAFGRRVPIVDANVRRVIVRFLALKETRRSEADRIIETFLKRALSAKDVGDFNQALMELGALVCRSQNPLCVGCPLRKRCRAWRQGLQDVIPAAVLRQIQDIEAVAAVIVRRGCVFLQQRGPKGLLAGLWEFPGGKIERAETPLQALRRELCEELSVEVKKARPLMTVGHAYTRFRVRLHVYGCRVRPLPKADKTHHWVSWGRLKDYPVPSATARIIEELESSLGPDCLAHERRSDIGG